MHKQITIPQLDFRVSKVLGALEDAGRAYGQLFSTFPLASFPSGQGTKKLKKNSRSNTGQIKLVMAGSHEYEQQQNQQQRGDKKKCTHTHEMINRFPVNDIA
ncbi:uncharacterized protein VTP21DRAFT_8972 [Calcarisporiella thermophila]|uniref:uncharacterized protein n=1 Tax=Calcarisporiella thermophila TaxID=911321 RepID=UPI003742928E